MEVIPLSVNTSVHFFDSMSQNDRMKFDALNDLKQGILSTIQLDGIEAAQSRYIENLPALSLERRKMQQVFSELEQDQAGKWSFRLSDEEKIGQAIGEHHTTLDGLAQR